MDSVDYDGERAAESFDLMQPLQRWRPWQERHKMSLNLSSSRQSNSRGLV